MKREKKFGKILTGVLTFVLAFALTFSYVSPMTAQAKTKTITLKSPVGGNKMFLKKNADKTAKSVKKGSYTIRVNKKGYDGEGFLKFKAPKTKTYTFTINNLKAPKDDYANGYMAILKQGTYTPNVLVWQDKIKTKNGKTNSVQFADKEDTKYHTNAYGKLKIKKGQTVYLYFSASGTYSDSVTFNLNIK